MRKWVFIVGVVGSLIYLLISSRFFAPFYPLFIGPRAFYPFSLIHYLWIKKFLFIPLLSVFFILLLTLLPFFFLLLRLRLRTGFALLISGVVAWLFFYVLFFSIHPPSLLYLPLLPPAPFPRFSIPIFLFILLSFLYPREKKKIMFLNHLFFLVFLAALTLSLWGAVHLSSFYRYPFMPYLIPFIFFLFYPVLFDTLTGRIRSFHFLFLLPSLLSIPAFYKISSLIKPREREITVVVPSHNFRETWVVKTRNPYDFYVDIFEPDSAFYAEKTSEWCIYGMKWKIWDEEREKRIKALFDSLGYFSPWKERMLKRISESLKNKGVIEGKIKEGNCRILLIKNVPVIFRRRLGMVTMDVRYPHDGTFTFTHVPEGEYILGFVWDGKCTKEIEVKPKILRVKNDTLRVEVYMK